MQTTAKFGKTLIYEFESGKLDYAIKYSFCAVLQMALFKRLINCSFSERKSSHRYTDFGICNCNIRWI